MSCALFSAELSKPGFVLNKRDLQRLARVSEVQRTFLKERARRWLQQRQHRTILFYYGSDCTPLTTRKRVEHAVLGQTVARRGKSCDEFLIQRAYMCDLDGSSTCIMEMPLALADKTAFTHFAAARKFFKTPREEGHEALCVIAHVYDRVVQAPMARLFRQWRALSQSRVEDEDADGRAYRLDLQCWYVSVGCFAHDCHGGLKWALLQWSNDKQVLRSAFASVESVRSSNSLLMKHVAPWIARHIHYEDWAGIDAGAVYMALDVDASWLDIFSDLAVRLSGGRLLIAERHRGRSGLMDVMTGVFMKILTWHQWSESRWLSLGGSCRQLALGLLLGLESLVSHVLDAGKSKYHLGHVHEHLRAEVRHFILVGAFASRVADSLLQMVVVSVCLWFARCGPGESFFVGRRFYKS